MDQKKEQEPVVDLTAYTPMPGLTASGRAVGQAVRLAQMAVARDQAREVGPATAKRVGLF